MITTVYEMDNGVLWSTCTLTSRYYSPNEINIKRIYQFIRILF